MAYFGRSYQRGYRRPFIPYQRRSRGLHSTHSVHKRHEMKEFGPGSQDPMEEGLLKINQGFSGGGAGRSPTGDDDTNVSGSYLCLFSPTARMPSTGLSLFPEATRLSQRYSSNTLAKGIRETVYIGLGYQATAEDDNSDKPNMFEGGSLTWLWRRIVIRTKLGSVFKNIGEGAPEGDLWSAMRLVSGEHVRPVIPVVDTNYLTNIVENLFRDFAGNPSLDGFANSVVDTQRHSVLYDKRTVLRPPAGGGRLRFDLYHEFGHMMEYDDEDGRTGYAQHVERDAVQWGDVFIFDFFEQPRRLDRAVISVNIPVSTYYWHERPI